MKNNKDIELRSEEVQEVMGKCRPGSYGGG